ncbi:MAG: hypothetical protein HOL00_05730 [Methylococcales bacterium]|nr:hypothetical protein [Methylococcales bacterium]MBT4348466.1 hypothetical protein [Methylococcales bacterium]MBT4600137.1 hypothetical protein [Methylococcales bacterium]MBT6523881.1 hypothetical protein [Methylococcales bacterium]MBT7969168.1 hypothetical protein [Methylococcales bacterium]
MLCKFYDKTIPQIAKSQLIQGIWTVDSGIVAPTLSDYGITNIIGTLVPETGIIQTP